MLFPAPAGMIPVFGTPTFVICAFPRTRGDDPDGALWYFKNQTFSPHPRG